MSANAASIARGKVVLSDRAFQIHFARVMLAEAAKRRHHPANRNFYWTLVKSAQGARKRAEAMRQIQQTELFA